MISTSDLQSLQKMQFTDFNFGIDHIDHCFLIIKQLHIDVRVVRSCDIFASDDSLEYLWRLSVVVFFEFIVKFFGKSQEVCHCLLCGWVVSLRIIFEQRFDLCHMTKQRLQELIPFLRLEMYCITYSYDISINIV